MQAQILHPYTCYNSVLVEGKRIRRMRRTEQSAQKIYKTSSEKKLRFRTQNYTSRSKGKEKDTSRSLPKVERKWRAQMQQNQTKKTTAEQEYQMGRSYNTSVLDNHNKNKLQQSNLHIEKSSSKSKIHQSINKNLNQSRKQINEKSVQQLRKSLDSKRLSKQIFRNSQRSSQNQQNSQNGSKISKQSQKQKQSLIGVWPANSPSQVKQSFLKSSGKSSVHNQQNQSIQSIGDAVSNKSNSIIKAESTNVNKLSKPISHDYSSKMDDYGFKVSERVYSNNSNVQNNQNNEKDIQMSNLGSNSSKNDKNPSIHRNESDFQSIAQNFEQNLPPKPEAQNLNFSKLKIDEFEHVIINNSSPKRQSWREAIKSFTDLSQMDNSGLESQTKNKMLDSTKKFSLRIDSLKQDPGFPGDKYQSSNRTSWKHLPLASKEPSKKMQESLIERADVGSLKNVLENIEIHDYLVCLINEFREEIQESEQDDDTGLLCFLLTKKYFLEKSNMIKALKGGKNVFALTSIEIPSDSLQLYMYHPEVDKIVKDMEISNRDLFKKMEKEYLEVKQKYRNNPYIKLQTPSDNFSHQIVRILQKYIQSWYAKLKETDNEEEQEKLENIIFDSMEIVFLLSQMSGRQVKKIEFLDDVTDFEEYYKQNEKNLKQTFQYFASMR